MVEQLVKSWQFVAVFHSAGFKVSYYIYITIFNLSFMKAKIFVSLEKNLRTIGYVPNAKIFHES